MRSIRELLVSLVVLLGVSGLLGACGVGSPDAGADSGAEVVNIGYSGPLSGGAAFYGRNVLDGLTMAVDEINAAGGIEVDGRMARLNIVSLDDRYLPNETATNARRLMQQSRTPVIFVPHAGGILAVQGMNTRDPKFLLGAYSSEPRILEAGNPLTLMIPPRYDNYAEPFVRTAMQRFGSRLGLVPTTTAYGRAWTEMITAEWRRQGGQVGGNHGVDYNTTTDFSGAVTQALAQNPDVIFVGGPSQQTALVIRAAREQGFRGGFIIMDQSKFEEMDDIVPMSMLEGAIGIHPQETYPAPGTEQFVARYYEKFGRERPPTSEVALNYQAMHLIAQAMSLAGTTSDPEAIRAHASEAAARLPEEWRVTGLERVSEQGHLGGPMVAAVVQGEQFVPIPIPAVR